MNNPFGVNEEGRVFISDAQVKEGCMSIRLVSGIGIEMPDGWAERAQEKADLLEHRLSRIEQALGLSSICAD
ncbi:hypothetical protein YA0783_25460 [Pseudomonas corrugata]|uniref:hypothetical protein n=1 Tax=Pseudomonas corrugata TaxID=47879 RepID=UPI0018E617BD|nr:hypothetical protein [Pseudomonas corrugata]MBI6621640.1 hypothetical protein [Pseudomonas corrugata]MBI6695818.1 hypothetical protein [Pseudomonas corrugata]